MDMYVLKSLDSSDNKNWNIDVYFDLKTHNILCLYISNIKIVIIQLTSCESAVPTVTSQLAFLVLNNFYFWTSLETPTISLLGLNVCVVLAVVEKHFIAQIRSSLNTDHPPSHLRLNAPGKA